MSLESRISAHAKGLLVLAVAMSLIAGLILGRSARRSPTTHPAAAPMPLQLRPPVATSDGGILLGWTAGPRSATYVVILADEDREELRRFGPVAASEIRLDPADLPAHADILYWRVVGFQDGEPVEASAPARYRAP